MNRRARMLLAYELLRLGVPTSPRAGPRQCHALHDSELVPLVPGAHGLGRRLLVMLMWLVGLVVLVFVVWALVRGRQGQDRARRTAIPRKRLWRSSSPGERSTRKPIGVDSRSCAGSSADRPNKAPLTRPVRCRTARAPAGEDLIAASARSASSTARIRATSPPSISASSSAAANAVGSAFSSSAIRRRSCLRSRNRAPVDQVLQLIQRQCPQARYRAPLEAPGPGGNTWRSRRNRSTRSPVPRRPASSPTAVKHDHSAMKRGWPCREDELTRGGDDGSIGRRSMAGTGRASMGTGRLNGDS
jgi:hypothetical protein